MPRKPSSTKTPKITYQPGHRPAANDPPGHPELPRQGRHPALRHLGRWQAVDAVGLREPSLSAARERLRRVQEAGDALLAAVDAYQAATRSLDDLYRGADRRLEVSTAGEWLDLGSDLGTCVERAAEAVQTHVADLLLAASEAATEPAAVAALDAALAEVRALSVDRVLGVEVETSEARRLGKAVVDDLGGQSLSDALELVERGVQADSTIHHAALVEVEHSLLDDVHGVVMTSLHARAAAALGWSVADAQSLSLQSLRDLVRPIAPDLAADISEAVSTGRHIRRVDKAVVVEAARAQAQQARQGVTPPRDGTHVVDAATAATEATEGDAS